MAGTVLTNKGLALITKLMAAQATLSFSRVAVGTGRVPSGYDAKNMTGLNEYKMDATIESCGVSTEQSDVAYIVTQISSVGVSTGFAITEAGVFATDPDDGEILYAYLDLTQDPQYIYASTDAISKFAEITFNVLVGSVTSVTAIVSPGALVKKSEFDNLKTRVEDVETPEFDASGTAEGITDKTSLLASFVTKMPLVKFMRNVVAGFKLVLYSGQIVNNCVTDRPDLPGSAAQLKVLMDLYTVLNTNFNNKQNREWIYAATLSNKNTASVGVNIRNYREACIIINGHRKSGSIMIVDDVLHFIAPEAGTGTMAFMYLVKVNIVNGGFGLYVEAANRICFLESNAWLENRNWSNSFNLYIR